MLTPHKQMSVTDREKTIQIKFDGFDLPLPHRGQEIHLQLQYCIGVLHVTYCTFVVEEA